MMTRRKEKKGKNTKKVERHEKKIHVELISAGQRPPPLSGNGSFFFSPDVCDLFSTHVAVILRRLVQPGSVSQKHLHYR